MKKLFSPQSGDKKKAQVLAFLNQKGGVGKTTLAFNTAHALARQGARVLCLDFDPQANLGILFADPSLGSRELEDETYHIFHLLINSIKDLKGLHSSAHISDILRNVWNSDDFESSIDFIPSGHELSGLELTVAGIRSPRQLLLKKFLESNDLREEYDYILIDSPPTLGLLVVNILCASTGIIVPFRPDDFSRQGLKQLHQTLEDIDEMGVSSVPRILAYVPNLVDARRKLDVTGLEKMIFELKELEKEGRVTPCLYNRALLGKSQAKKQSVFDHHSKEHVSIQKNFNYLVKIIEEARV